MILTLRGVAVYYAGYGFFQLASHDAV
ncbi:MAG: hypothetical protein Q610_ECBC00271G0001, partial [Escherichia coli DORA_B_14]